MKAQQAMPKTSATQLQSEERRCGARGTNSLLHVTPQFDSTRSGSSEWMTVQRPRMRRGLMPNADRSAPPTDLDRLLGMITMSLAVIATSSCLPFIILPASTLISCLFLVTGSSRNMIARSGSGCGFHSLRKRNRLPERGAFFEQERAGRIHIPSNEEDFRLRNMDDASGIEAHVLIEVAPEQPVNIDFYQLIPLALLRLLIAVLD